MSKCRKIFRRMLVGIFFIVLAAVLVFIFAGLVPVKDKESDLRKSTYVKMKDGTKIAVRYRLPVSMKKGEKVPAIMESTRYGTENKRSFLLNALVNLKIAKEIPPVLVGELSKAKYAFVEVDARGSGASFGNREMEFSKEEVSDMGQIIEWIVSQNWSNGKVGTYGMSYSGNTAELAMSSNHRALLAAAPLYPDFDAVSQLAVPGGIFNDVLIKEWHDYVAAADKNKTQNLFSGGTAPVTQDKNESLLREAIKGHRTVNIHKAFKEITYFDDVLSGNYKANSISPYNYASEIQKSQVPLYVRVGWQDAGTVNGALERFLTYSNSQTLVIGPWSHAGWYNCDPFIKNSFTKMELDKLQAQEVIRFFDQHLKKDKDFIETKKEIQYYTLGEGKWKTTSKWPVAGFDNKTFYFAVNGSLSENKPDGTIGKDTYKVDFTASTGKNNRWYTNMGGGAISYPDRAQEDKKLLTYTTKALENDVEITGVPQVTLNLSSTATDGAFFSYLEDVAPDGKVTYITEGQLRGIHRKLSDEDLGRKILGPVHSYLRKDGSPLTPGKNEEIKIGMYATSVLIKKGHKIRIAIAGHDAANFARIPEEQTPVLDIQRNSSLFSFVELPMKNR